MFEEMGKIKSGKRELREFGVTMGAILIVLGDIALLRGRVASLYLLGAGTVFAGLGIALPEVLKPLQKAWMAFGLLIGFFMSRLILSLLFYAVITPIGLMMKLLGKDILDERIDRKKISYWHVRTGRMRPKESYENQY